MELVLATLETTLVPKLERIKHLLDNEIIPIMDETFAHGFEVRHLVEDTLGASKVCASTRLVVL